MSHYHLTGMLQVPLKDEEKCNDEDPYKDPEARPTDVFFLSVIPVPPTKFRPVSMSLLFYCQILILLNIFNISGITSFRSLFTHGLSSGVTYRRVGKNSQEDKFILFADARSIVTCDWLTLTQPHSIILTTTFVNKFWFWFRCCNVLVPCTGHW